MEFLLIIIFSYIIGSIPFGLIITKTFINKDIRNIGSGNIGATNVLRTGNKFIALLTLVCDILKGIIPVLICKLNFNEFLYYASIFALIGHIFPIWLKFKGGKGIATFIGILFILNYFYCGIFLLIWILTNLLFKYSSLSSLISTFSIMLFSYINENIENFYFYIVVTLLFFYTHRDNIKRLSNKSEKKTIFFKKK